MLLLFIFRRFYIADIQLQIPIAPELIHFYGVTDVERISPPDIFKMISLAEGYGRHSFHPA